MPSTLVTTLPFALHEEKPGLIPSVFEIPAAKNGEIETYIVKDAYHLQYVTGSDDKMPPLRIPHLSDEIARALIYDYISGSIGVGSDLVEANGMMVVAKPGMFYVDGVHSARTIKEKFPAEVLRALAETAAWFTALIKLADDDWQKYQQHRMINELHRAGLKYLGQERAWDYSTIHLKRTDCWSCKTPLNPTAIVCFQCKAIVDEKAFEANKGKFAKGA